MDRLPSGGVARLLLSALLLPLRVGSAACPCQDPTLCNPITTTRDFEVRRRNVGQKHAVCAQEAKANPPTILAVSLQILVFDVGGKTWKFYNWTQITTVATFGKYDPELMCYAHSKGSRVVLKGEVSVKAIVDPAVRAAWINQKVELAKTQYMDGINIDIEQEVNKFSAEYYALTALVKETTEAFHKEIPGSQVTFDVAWSPECIDGRCYNYTGIADSCDFVFVMSYDEQSQVWSECIARANAPYNQTLAVPISYGGSSFV
ncbi:Di-N-acetylchitobiase [Varanus komodoensis]|nr:Di-N-acetylchitobiase [Varanus komodoensis]